MRLTVPSPIGELTAIIENGAVTGLLRGEIHGADRTATAEDGLLAERLRAELVEYFRGERRHFDLPVSLTGTPFQKRVWDALGSVLWGEVRTYGEIAAAIGQPNAARAVGGACHNNPVLILVPCHRIVGANGIGGFGCGRDAKQILLEIERTI